MYSYIKLWFPIVVLTWPKRGRDLNNFDSALHEDAYLIDWQIVVPEKMYMYNKNLMQAPEVTKF